MASRRGTGPPPADPAGVGALRGRVNSRVTGGADPPPPPPPTTRSRARLVPFRASPPFSVTVAGDVLCSCFAALRHMTRRWWCAAARALRPCWLEGSSSSSKGRARGTDTLASRAPRGGGGVTSRVTNTARRPYPNSYSYPSIRPIHLFAPASGIALQPTPRRARRGWMPGAGAAPARGIFVAAAEPSAVLAALRVEPRVRRGSVRRDGTGRGDARAHATGCGRAVPMRRREKKKRGGNGHPASTQLRTPTTIG